ncbi:MAG: hypothetical protein GEU75_11505 [Dehalococcoidia bacterium]|nr:hypothetical protein [Dehalococcoidia bacterium]
MLGFLRDGAINTLVQVGGVGVGIAAIGITLLLAGADNLIWYLALICIVLGVFVLVLAVVLIGIAAAESQTRLTTVKFLLTPEIVNGYALLRVKNSHSQPLRGCWARLERAEVEVGGTYQIGTREAVATEIDFEPAFRGDDIYFRWRDYPETVRERDLTTEGILEIARAGVLMMILGDDEPPIFSASLSAVPKAKSLGMNVEYRLTVEVGATNAMLVRKDYTLFISNSGAIEFREGQEQSLESKV